MYSKILTNKQIKRKQTREDNKKRKCIYQSGNNPPIVSYGLSNIEKDELIYKEIIKPRKKHIHQNITDDLNQDNQQENYDVNYEDNYENQKQTFTLDDLSDIEWTDCSDCSDIEDEVTLLDDPIEPIDFFKKKPISKRDNNIRKARTKKMLG